MEEYISRAEAQHALSEKRKEVGQSDGNWTEKELSLATTSLALAVAIIISIPAADVRPVVRGEWEKVMEQPYLRKRYHVVACSGTAGQTRSCFTSTIF